MTYRSSEAHRITLGRLESKGEGKSLHERESKLMVVSRLAGLRLWPALLLTAGLSVVARSCTVLLKPLSPLLHRDSCFSNARHISAPSSPGLSSPFILPADQVEPVIKTWSSRRERLS